SVDTKRGGVAEAVADQLDGEHGEVAGEPGEDRQPPRHAHEVTPEGDHLPQAGCELPMPTPRKGRRCGQQIPQDRVQRGWCRWRAPPPLSTSLAGPAPRPTTRV